LQRVFRITFRSTVAVPTPTLEEAPARRPRADAVRNRARIVETAREVFAQRGSDASLEEIARGAGVGIGTLYRHFPTRDDLVAAVFHDRIDELEALAEELLASSAPGEALVTWLHAQLEQASTCQGLAAEAMLAMLAHTDAPSPCESMRQAGAALLARAQAAGEVRSGVDIDDLVRMVQAVTLAAEECDDPDAAERLFGFVLDGVRAR
jgi:AcrR family transcriptional regulator